MACQQASQLYWPLQSMPVYPPRLCTAYSAILKIGNNKKTHINFYVDHTISIHTRKKNVFTRLTKRSSLFLTRMPSQSITLDRLKLCSLQEPSPFGGGMYWKRVQLSGRPFFCGIAKFVHSALKSLEFGCSHSGIKHLGTEWDDNNLEIMGNNGKCGRKDTKI